jgi:hypothetical protein
MRFSRPVSPGEAQFELGVTAVIGQRPEQAEL